MRVGFDARTLDWAGVGTYSRSLLQEFARMDMELVVFCQDQMQDVIPVSPHLRLVGTDIGAESQKGGKEFAALVAEQKVDLLHVPCYLTPPDPPVPLVCTIHDVIPLVYPRSVRSPIARSRYRSRLRQALEQADHIITVSQISLSTLSVYAGVDLGKVRVIHNGVGEQFRPVSEPDVLAAIRSTYDLPERFALWIGEFRPHKNLMFLLETWPDLQAKLPEPLPLVLAGPQEGLFRATKGMAAKKGLRDLVLFPGYIRAQDLPAVYSAATVFVFPSLYEGFGLPPLEAMACGTPCVVSNSSALPEVTGRAALLFNPTSREQLIDCIIRVVTQPETAALLREEGFRQAALFSWRKAALETLGVYQRVLQCRASSGVA